MRAIPQRTGGRLLAGDFADYRADPLQFWLDIAARGPLVRIRFGPITRTVVNDPELARHILQRNHQNYRKDQRIKRLLEKGTGPVLATSDGDAWRWRRQLLQPKFKRSEIAHFAPMIVHETRRLMSAWSNGQTIDIAQAMKSLTMNIIGRTMFSVDFATETAELAQAYRDFAANIFKRLQRFVNFPYAFPNADNRELRRVTTTIGMALGSILADRRQHPTPRGDLLDMLLTHRLEESEHRMSEAALIHEMSAIVFAGHETTATTLTWLFYALARYPRVAVPVRRELADVLGGQTPDVNNVRSLQCLERVINEVLRLYPPLYVNSRQAIAADELGDYRIEPGTRLLINILGIQRQHQHWPDPDRFDPDRFLPEPVRTRHRFAFLPFLMGPRRCLGATMAMLEMQLIAPLILQRFTPVLEAGQSVTPQAQVVLAPQGGLRMRLAASGSERPGSEKQSGSNNQEDSC